MPETGFDIADFGLDVGALAGSLGERLAAARAAGFAQVDLPASALVDHPDGLDAAVRLLAASGLRVTALHALHGFEGLDGAPHAYRVEQARGLLDLCGSVGARLLLVRASAAPQASADPAALARDLRKLAMLAVPRRVRIGYAAAVDSPHAGDFLAAWDLVFQADAPNLGLVLDAVDVLSGAVAGDDLDLLDPAKVFLVQLTDLLWPAAAPEARVRVLPGEGAHGAALADLLRRLDALGYRGDYGLAADLADARQLPAARVAERARRAALWLAEDVLRRSAPLPGRMRLRRR